MKKFFPLVLAAAFLAGCATRYDITLNNGTEFTGVSKPVLNQATGEYYFTDAFGRQRAVKEMRVRVIEPHKEGGAKGRFRPSAS